MKWAECELLAVDRQRKKALCLPSYARMRLIGIEGSVNEKCKYGDVKDYLVESWYLQHSWSRKFWITNSMSFKKIRIQSKFLHSIYASHPKWYQPRICAVKNIPTNFHGMFQVLQCVLLVAFRDPLSLSHVWHHVRHRPPTHKRVTDRNLYAVRCLCWRTRDAVSMCIPRQTDDRRTGKQA